MIYLIAGASLTGKSSCRLYIAKQHGISGIDTDTLRAMSNELLPHFSVGYKCSVSENYYNLRPVVKAFIHARSHFSEPFLLEGDAINLEDAVYCGSIIQTRAVVLGFPNASVDKILSSIIVKANRSHWTGSLNNTILCAKIKEFIAYSQFLQVEAARLGLPFIDTGELTLDQLYIRVDKYLFPDS